MNQFLQLLKPWEKSNKKVYICHTNQHLKKASKQLFNISKILNTNIDITDSSSYRDYLDQDCNFYIIPTIRKNCNPLIYIDNNLHINNNKIGLILQDTWNDPEKISIEFAKSIEDFTSFMFNIFFTYFFNNIKSNRINIYINVIDKYSEAFFEKISKLTVFYNNEPVQFNCHIGLPLVELKLAENDFLIVRLQKINTNNLKQNISCSVKRINIQELHDNTNKVNVSYFEIVEDISNIYGSNNNFKQLISLCEYFIDIPIYLQGD